MKLAKVLAFLFALTAVAGAQVSAPDRASLSYEVRDKARTIHNWVLEVDGFVVRAETAVEQGDEYTLHDTTVRFPAGNRVRRRITFTGDALRDLPTSPPQSR
jgi:hypothetical protein